MDEKDKNIIKKVADLIRSGELNSARQQLTDVLKRDDQLEEAWFLLSHTLPAGEKQIFALQQALKINPNFDRAAKRLEKLRIEPEDAVEEIEESESSENEEWEVAPPFELSEEPAFELETDASKEEPAQEDLDFTSPFHESTFTDEEEDEVEDKNSPPRLRKLLYALLIVAVLALLILFGNQFIVDLNQNTNEVVPVSTATEVQGFRALPPTWTPDGSDPAASESP